MSDSVEMQEHFVSKIQQAGKILIMSLKLLLWFRLYIPVSNFLVMPGWNYNFLGINPCSGEVSCSRTLHGGGRYHN